MRELKGWKQYTLQLQCRMLYDIFLCFTLYIVSVSAKSYALYVSLKPADKKYWSFWPISEDM